MLVTARFRISSIAAPQTSLAGSTAVFLNSNANEVRGNAISVTTPAAGGCQIGMYDGTNFQIDTTLGASVGFCRNQWLTTGIGLRINNTTVNALTYMYCGPGFQL